MTSRRLLIALLSLPILGHPWASGAEPAKTPTAQELQLRQEREAADARVPTTQPASRFPQWEQQARGRMAKAKAEGSRISVIFDGDSITDGWMNPQRGLKVWTERLVPHHAFDLGINGDKTQHVLWRLAQGQMEGLQPRLVVLMIGTNNIGRSWSPEQVADGVKEVATQYRRHCPKATILLQGILPRGDAWDQLRIDIRATNALLAAWAPTAGILFRDFGDRFLELDGKLKADCFLDKTHPNEKGYGIWVDAIQDILDQYAPRIPEKP